jgi:hypothetical protein
VSYQIKFWKIRKRNRPKPYELRWVVDGRDFSQSFLNEELAEAFKAEIIMAARNFEPFDEATGLPESMLRKQSKQKAVTWYEHAQDFARTWWPRSAAKSRVSIVESLACVTPVLVRDQRGGPDRDLLRAALRKAFNQNPGRQPLTDAERQAIRWIEKRSLPLSALNDESVTADVLDALATKLNGQPAAADYFSRRRRVIRTCLYFAVRKKRLADNPLASRNLPDQWKPPQAEEEVDPRAIASPELVAEMLVMTSYVGTGQGPRFVAFFGCMFYAMMRPEEVIGLYRAGCSLPESGWGLLTFGDSSPAAGRDFTDDGQVHEHRGLKGRSRKAVRRVPIPPELVALLRAHIARFGTAPDGRIFRSVSGAKIQPSTYWQVWQKVRALALSPQQRATPLMRRPYDLRHSGVTWRLNSGIPAPEVAKWAGHSVEVLTRTYARCVAGLDDVWISRMDETLRPRRSTR